jgi:hypothetical protein
LLDVYLSIDVEVWCDGWEGLDEKFPAAFERYVYGPGRQFGLPHQLQMIAAHGLKAVCFVEPLFAGRFGHAPLQEIVGLVETTGHEAQLHLHTEWVDEARVALLPARSGKRQHLRQFSLDEQAQLIHTGKAWLQGAGAPAPLAFRAGSFGLNSDTPLALAANDIFIDSSYNASTLGPSSGVRPGELPDQAFNIGPVLEVPMTTYQDGRGLRHAQLTACSYSEIAGLLWAALESRRSGFMILSHNFELLTPDKSRPDAVVVRRLAQLCAFLERHRDCFRVRGFRDMPRPQAAELPLPPPLQSPLWRTGMRMVEQAWRSAAA